MREKVKLTANILFSGIGCQERGFRDSGLFDIEVLNTSDINKESVLSYAAIHCGMTNEMVDAYKDYPSREEMAQYLTDINLGYEPEKNKYFDWFKLVKRKKKDLEKYWLACKLTHNLGDITKIEDLPYADFWTVSFCCQDISIAGKMKGLKPDSGTRSSLLWDNIRLLSKAKENNKLPQYIMFENVKNLVSKKFIDDFNDLLDVLDELGFNSYWSVINGKDCGVPQSRERVFVISIRKDIDSGKYTFPEPFDTGIRLKNILEDCVDEKYYISENRMKIIRNNLGNVFEKNFIIGSSQKNAYIGDDIIAPTLTSAMGNGGGQIPMIKQIGIDKTVKNARQIEYANCITSREDRGVSNRKAEGTAILETPDISYCLDANYWKGITLEQYMSKKRRQLIFEQISQWIRIRKLTPRECYRLMGLTFEDCDKASEIGVADTHLYKQAGNGIITNCCALLAEHLYKAQYNNTYICTDEEYQGNFTKQQVE